MMKIAMYGTLDKGFETPKGAKVSIHLLPMDSSSGKKTVSIETDPFFFGHFLNTFSPGPGKITFDLDRQEQIFFDRFSFDVQRNKSKRDSWAAEHGDAYSTPTRYEVDVEAGTVTSKPLFPDPKTQCAPNSKWCEFDLFKLHPEDIGRPYCGFWSQQVFFNSSSFGSQGIVRADLCGQEGPKVVASWHRPNTYPGELQFVPKPGSKDKTEGVVIFKTYEGDTKLSKLIVADAKTLETVASAVLPVRIPFTVHGNFYPATSKGHCVASDMSAATKVFV
jgi:carotenoid cleavage dioxygenase-like enzyme